MVSKVIITRTAQRQLNSYIEYLLTEFKSKQAARSLSKDARKTKQALLTAADILQPCEDEDLAALDYRVIHFRSHRYLFVYTIEDGIARIDGVYHELQDYENIFKREVLGL